MKSLGRGLAALIPSRESTRPAVGLGAADQDAHGDRVRVLYIPVEDLRPNPHQPRKLFSGQELEELAASIRVHGILEPLIASPSKDGMGYELIAGERRLRAAKMAGLKTVPTILRSAGEREKLELSIIENIQRADLNPIERAHAYRSLLENFNMTPSEVYRRVGKSQSSVSNTMRLLTLPGHMQQAIAQGKLGEAHARSILVLDDPKLQEELYQKILAQKLTQYEVEQTVRDIVGKLGKRHYAKVRRGGKGDPDLAAGEKLAERLATRVRIYRTGEHGTITISFSNPKDFQRLMTMLGG